MVPWLVVESFLEHLMLLAFALSLFHRSHLHQSVRHNLTALCLPIELPVRATILPKRERCWPLPMLSFLLGKHHSGVAFQLDKWSHLCPHHLLLDLLPGLPPCGRRPHVRGVPWRRRTHQCHGKCKSALPMAEYLF